MTTILRILRKDLRLFRLPIAVWLAVLAGETAFALSSLDARVGSLPRFTAWSLGSYVGAIAHVLLALVLLVGVVQADGPLSATAFWRTRPIGRWPLLGAKLTFVFGVLVAPWVLGNFLVLLGRGATVGDALATASTLLMVLVALAIPVMGVAALTPTLANSLVGVVATAAYVFIVVESLFSLAPRWLAPIGAPGRQAIAGFLLAGLLGALAVLLAYRGDRRGVLALVLLGVPVAVLAVNGVAWGHPTTCPELPPSLRLEARTLSEPTSLQVWFEGQEQWRPWPMEGAAQVIGVPANQRVEVLEVRADVTASDGGAKRLILRGFQLRPRERASENRQTVSFGYLGPTTVLAPLSTAWIPDRLYRLPGQKSTRGVGAYVRLALVADRVEVVVPLQPGAAARSGSLRIQIISVGHSFHPEVEVRESEPEPPLWAFPKPIGGLPSIRRHRYWIYNRATREVLPVLPANAKAQSVPFVAFGLDLRSMSVRIEWPESAPWLEAAAREAWLENADLMRTETMFLAVGERFVESLSAPPLPELLSSNAKD